MANLKKGLNASQQQILKLIHGYLTHREARGKTVWSLISQNWILQKLEEWYDHKITRSALSYNLAYLKRLGYLDITTRHRKNPETGEIEFRVSLYKMTFRLRAHFMQWATYFRNISWKNYISKGKRVVAAVRQQAEAAASGMSAKEFFDTMRNRGIVKSPA